MTNLGSILKSRDITLPTKVCIVKAVVFRVAKYGCESWTIKKAEHWRIDAFELWCWRTLLRVPWTARRSNQSILNIHWKDWCWSWSSNMLATWCKVETHWKRPWCWERLKAGRKGGDRGWDGWMHHRHNELEFEQAPGDGQGQGSLECYNPRGRKESDTTEQLNNKKTVWLGRKNNLKEYGIRESGSYIWFKFSKQYLQNTFIIIKKKTLLMITSESDEVIV